jgi:two-component system sensor histidine kinase HydH
MMKSKFALRAMLPTALFSILMLAVGIVAARYVQELQRSNTDIVARQVAAMTAAQDLMASLREMRHQLNLYLRNADEEHLKLLPQLRVEADSLLATADRLSRTLEERTLIEPVARGTQAFFNESDRLLAPSFTGDRHRELIHLVEDYLNNDVLAPSRAFVEFNRQAIEGTSQQSQALANRIRLGLILLGVCGAVGGVLAGAGLALAISRSVVQLQVPIRGAAGKLNEVVGPVTFSVGSGLDGLNQVLEQMAEHVGTVVERLQQREREALRTEHLAAVGQLAAGLAHELRNPLMPIKIMVQAARDLGDQRGLHGRDLLVIEEEITRLERSIQDFLDFARPPEPEKAVFDLRSVVRQTLDLLAARAERQYVRLAGHLPAEPVEIEADRGQLRQIIINLVLNALDALPGGGTIDVQLSVAVNESCLAADGLLRHALMPIDPGPAPRRQAVLRVTDDGAGIADSILPRVFEPFVSTKETGTGLGLSICQRIAEAHGGTLVAGNRMVGGAEFICRLPMSPAVCSRPTPSAPPSLAATL